MSEQNEIPVQPIGDEIDDVEGHGLREVAAAAGIGAAVLSAGGVALAASGGPGPVGPRTPSAVTQITDDSNRLVGDIAQGAVTLAGQTGADAQAFATQATGDVTQFASPETTLATNTATGAEKLAGDEVQATYSLAGATEASALHTASDTVSAATNTATTAVDGATDLATRTAHTATTTVTSTANAALNTASSTVSSTLKTATTVEATALAVVNTTYDQAAKGWTVDLSVMGIRGTSSATLGSPTGTVSLVDSSGHTLASTNVVNGTGTLHVAATALGHGVSYTIQYAGGSGFLKSAVPWVSPTL